MSSLGLDMVSPVGQICMGCRLASTRTGSPMGDGGGIDGTHALPR